MSVNCGDVHLCIGGAYRAPYQQWSLPSSGQDLFVTFSAEGSSDVLVTFAPSYGGCAAGCVGPRYGMHMLRDVVAAN